MTRPEWTTRNAEEVPVLEEIRIRIVAARFPRPMERPDRRIRAFCVVFEPIFSTCVLIGMTGIHYVTDEQGKPTAVMLDLEQWGGLWEDIYDGLIAEQRKDEPLIPWEEVKRQLAQNRELPN